MRARERRVTRMAEDHRYRWKSGPKGILATANPCARRTRARRKSEREMMANNAQVQWEETTKGSQARHKSAKHEQISSSRARPSTDRKTVPTSGPISLSSMSSNAKSQLPCSAILCDDWYLLSTFESSCCRNLMRLALSNRFSPYRNHYLISSARSQ